MALKQGTEQRRTSVRRHGQEEPQPPRDDLGGLGRIDGISRVRHPLSRRTPVTRNVWDDWDAVRRDVVGHELRGGLQGLARGDGRKAT